tara:strand:- start:824 stop:1015 length:192 start_codon:yes stop_codon:yes gene_type:complete
LWRLAQREPALRSLAEEGLEAAKPKLILFSSKLTEPRANLPTGRQVSKASFSELSEVQFTIIC